MHNGKLNSMKILIVNTYGGAGGAAIACKRLHLALLSMGFDSRLLVLNQFDDAPQTYRFQDANTVLKRVHRRIELRYFNHKYIKPYTFNPKGNHLHSPTPSVFDLKKHELYDWADVINLHWVSRFIDFPTFFSKNTDKPIVWTMHDMNPFTGGCHHAVDCEGFKAQCEKCPQLSLAYQGYNHQNWRLKSKAHLKNLTLVAPSNWLKNAAQSSSLFKNQNHFVIPNSLDIRVFKQYNKRFCKDIFNIKSPSKILLFVAQNLSEPLKGMQYLLDALNEMKEKTTILIVGHTKIDLKNDDIIHLDTIGDERLMALLYNAADVFVTPSLAENLPNVVLESLCCGTPVVAFNIGGMPDLINNNENGFLVEQKDAFNLAKSLDKALTYDWDRGKISADAQKKYSSQKQVEAYIALFDSLVRK